MLWVDPADPSVFAAVSGLDFGDQLPDDPDVATAVSVASEILTLATAYLVHPAGQQTEEVITRSLHRFSPVYGPLTDVVEVVRVQPNGDTSAVAHRQVGNTIHVLSQGSSSTPLWRTNGSGGPAESVYRVTYRFGSTLTPGSRQAALHYARQVYLYLTGSSECDLPEKVTSIDREGIGITLATPQDFLDRGRTGLPRVDEWLAQINPKRALRPSGVYTPDSPPGVGVNLRRL
jgi:hypothetical protein